MCGRRAPLLAARTTAECLLYSPRTRARAHRTGCSTTWSTLCAWRCCCPRASRCWCQRGGPRTASEPADAARLLQMKFSVGPTATVVRIRTGERARPRAVCVRVRVRVAAGGLSTWLCADFYPVLEHLDSFFDMFFLSQSPPPPRV
jgi:hypothetical protein